jgi:CrcB protein
LPGAGIGRHNPILPSEGNTDPVFGHDNRELGAVFVGGAVGTAVRAALATLTAPPPGHWPWATFTVNIVGAFILGFVTTRLLERLPLSAYRRPLLGTGLCGGLTTFSTMQVETVQMIERHHYGLAAGYTVVSVIAGLVAVYAATALARRVSLR